MMKQRLQCLCVALFILVSFKAAPLTVCDFESYAIGTTWTMWNVYSSSVVSTATVEADPTNPANKVLHVRLSEWNCYPEFTLPTELRGQALSSRYPMLRYRLYRSAEDASDYKQLAVYVGTQEVYRDEGYPYQGDKQLWQQKSYTLKAVDEDNASGVLRVGIHCDTSDYYMDDIQLAGPYDDYVTVEDGGVLDYCVSNTSSSYATISDNIHIPEGQTANVRTSRYSEWTGKVAGAGVLKIYAGGERSYLGSKDSKGTVYPDWSQHTGAVHVYPYKEVAGSCGFYGLIMSSGTFQPDNIDGSNYNSLLAGHSLMLHEGSRIAMESGTRGVRIGALQMEKGSVLSSYYKTGSSKSYYVIGCKGMDDTLAGDIIPGFSGNAIALIKEGNGVCTITGEQNDINGGVTVRQGTLCIDNDAESTLQNSSSGALGANGTLVLMNGTVLSGCGTVASPTEVYGTVRPGNAQTGTLQFVNAASAATAVQVTLHPEARLECRVKDAANHDALLVRGALKYSNKTQDFETSDRMPRLAIVLTDDASLQVNDEVVLLTASGKTGDDWQLDIRYPKAYTWVVEQRTTAEGGYQVVAKVTSLDYSGQGDLKDDEETGEGNGGYPDNDWTDDMTNETPLRTYADMLGKNIGVAAASYRYDLSKDEGATGIVAKEFNMLVGENEMKFDATEPSQNYFSYGASDAVMNLAERKSQAVRGHTLAWHSQVPAWVSQDGKKNNHNFTRQQLLDILKNHIVNVVGRYKGKISEWDVCNEVLDDDQSIVRTNPDAYQLRPSIWATYIGEDFIDSAFVWAHQVDPDAKLYINEYGAEFMGKTKTEAYYNLIKRLQKSNVPIDGCGLQCHLTTGELDTLKLEKNIQRYAALGLNCIITELDIALANPYAADALDVQALEYGAIARIWLRNDNCPSLLVWGIADHFSWRQNQPLLFDAGLNAKPAYYNVHAQLRKEVEKMQAGIRNTSSDASDRVVRSEFYNMAGQRIAAAKGMVLIRNHYAYGSVKTVKVIK